MNYYKIINQSLSEEMASYMQEAEAADHAADELAKEIHADSIVPSPYGEFGGILACSFAEGTEAPHFFRFAGKEDGYRYYEPTVTVKDSVETEGYVRGIERKQNNRNWYDVREITMTQARSMITYSRAIELAHIRWQGTNMSRLAEQYRLSPSWMEMYYFGKMDYAILCKKSYGNALRLMDREEFDENLREAMVLEQLLNANLGKKKIYRVRHVSGPKDAVRFYRKAAKLPLVPSGRLAEMLGVKFIAHEVSCPAFFKSEGYWYIATSGEIKNETVEEISELAYKTAEMKRGEN